MLMKATQTIRDAATLNPIEEEYWGFVYISPEVAKQWLLYNVRNRPINRYEVTKCKRLLTTGEWRDDYSVPIAFSRDRLHDGQHRLTAIAESGIGAVCRVLTHQKDDAFPWYDGQRRRTLGDRVQFDENATRNKDIAAIVSSYIEQIYNNGNTTPGGVTVPVANEVYEKHRDGIRFGAEFMAGKVAGITNATVAGVMGQMYERNAEYADEFASCLRTKGTDNKNAAILREYLVTFRHASGGRLGRRELWYRCVYACLNFLNGKEIKSLRRCNWDGVQPASSAKK